MKNAMIRPALRHGFTLLELLIACTITLMMMGAVVTMFATVSNGISDSRATMEMSERLRSASLILQSDLAGATTTMSPPRDPENNEGYFEYIEGPIGPVVLPGEKLTVNGNYTGTLRVDQPFVSRDDVNTVEDLTVGDNDDILMFTTRNPTTPFHGRCTFITPLSANAIAQGPDSRGAWAWGPTDMISSDTAEVVWFVRGRTLYRRVLVVWRPSVNHDLRRNGYLLGPMDTFYNRNDISIHPEVAASGTNASVPNTWIAVANTLGDLTKRENRFAHCFSPTDSYPFDARRWYQLGLPTLLETSSGGWNNTAWTGSLFNDTYRLDTTVPPSTTNPRAQQDMWSNNPFERVPGNRITTGGRYLEDVILNNVIGFDVKIWDPGAPIVPFYVNNNPNNPPVAALRPGDPGYIAALRLMLANKLQPLGFGAYVDLNYMCRLGPGSGTMQFMPNYPPTSYLPAGMAAWPATYFNGPAGIKYSTMNTSQPVRQMDLRLRGQLPSTTVPLRTYCGSWLPSVYDTFSTHYNRGGQFGSTTFTGQVTNGFDDPVPWVTYNPSGLFVTPRGDGIVDDPDEQETAPPYPYPMRGIQVKIRTFDPSSRAVREVTIVQDFVPQ